jgi:diketogulonate reductase-like aldo/keto reductase
MIRRKFADSGIKLPIVGQGTWKMGESLSRAAEEIAALRLGIELGMNHIDTAEMYGGGGAEELVGRSIAGMRHEVFLTSKVLPSNASYSGTLKACERSLKRLKTDWIDLYLLHWWSGRHPIVETMRAMQVLVAAGKIRFVGVSNLDGDQLRQAESAFTSGRLICNQVCYHMEARGIEFSLIPYCREQNMAVVAYSPFGSGNFISDRTRGGQVLVQIGVRHGKSPHQVALNFLTRLSGLFSIPKASSPDHVRENAEAVGWQLTAEDLAAIDHAFPPPAHEVPLEIM